MRDRLGIGHAVAFETRGEHEQVGFRVERREALRRYRAEHVDALAERVTRDVGIEPRGGVAVARAVAGDRQPPWQIGERRQRRIRTSKPLRGTIAPTDSSRTTPSWLPCANGAGSLPGLATVMRSAGTP